MLENQIKNQLSQIKLDYLEGDLVSAKMVKTLNVQDHRIQLHLVFPYPFESKKENYKSQILSALSPLLSQYQLDLTLTHDIERHNSSREIKSLAQIKNIIAVASGKGGVGKSTVSVNLALALAQEGARVGLLDADIYGPSQPTMLGSQQEKPKVKDGLLQPILRHGLQTMSIGYLIEEATPMVWRGPMIGKAMQQLINDTAWQDLDYLIVDLPPGTGDIQLTLCQKMPISGAIMVTTPQPLAVLDVGRACAMFKKLNVPMLGVIENMSYHTCSHCGETTNIFGEGGAHQLAKDYQLSVLASLPLRLDIREQTDHGTPIALKHDPLFIELSYQVAAKIALQRKDYSAKFPNIVVQNRE